MSSGRNHDPRGDGSRDHVPAEDGRDEAVERALGFVSRPTADPAFRARLRQQFLDVEAPSAAEPRMVPVRSATTSSRSCGPPCWRRAWR